MRYFGLVLGLLKHIWEHVLYIEVVLFGCICNLLQPHSSSMDAAEDFFFLFFFFFFFFWRCSQVSACLSRTSIWSNAISMVDISRCACVASTPAPVQLFELGVEGRQSEQLPERTRLQDPPICWVVS